MSAFVRPTAIRTVLRQALVATALCAAVAVPAVLSVDTESAVPAPVSAASEDNNWPVPSPAPVKPLN